MSKKKKKTQIFSSAVRSETPVYDQLVADSGFAPHTTTPLTGGLRNIPACAGLLEDNFS
jgi:hypothetical protein